MLVLKRNIGESIMIGDDIEILITAIRGAQVRIGVTAPASVKVHRKEVWERERLKAQAASKEKQ